MAWLDNKAWTTMQTQGSGNKHKKTWMRQSFSYHELRRSRRPEKTKKYVLGYMCVPKKEYYTRIDSTVELILAAM